MLKIAFDPIYKHPLKIGHRFPMEKYELLPDQLLRKNICSIDNFFSDRGLQSIPTMDLQGTEFQLLVWNALCSIPRGSTASYRSIAEQIGSPNASRAVGTACRINPIPLFIPCHRVVKQDHSIGQFALGTKNKKFLLEMESS